jgi:hypothetical protein
MLQWCCSLFSSLPLILLLALTRVLRVVWCAGVDFLWQVYLQHPLHKVANTAMDMLMHTYKEGWGGLDIHVFVR